MIQLRMAIIRKRVKINKAPTAPIPQWEWQTQVREELQFMADGVWHPVPVEELPLDDADERAEAKARDAGADMKRAEMKKNIQRAEVLRKMEGFNEAWVEVDPDEFDRFIEFHGAEVSAMDPDGIRHYRSEGGTGDIIATAKRNKYMAPAGKLVKWLDPFSFDVSM